MNLKDLRSSFILLQPTQHTCLKLEETCCDLGTSDNASEITVQIHSAILFSMVENWPDYVRYLEMRLNHFVSQEEVLAEYVHYNVSAYIIRMRKHVFRVLEKRKSMITRLPFLIVNKCRGLEENFASASSFWNLALKLRNSASIIAKGYCHPQDALLRRKEKW